MLDKVSLQFSKFHRDLSREFHAMAKCRGQKLELCSGSRIRGCDLMSSAKNCTASYLQRHAHTNVCRKITDRAKSEYYVGDDGSDLFVRLSNFVYIRVYMN